MKTAAFAVARGHAQQGPDPKRVAPDPDDLQPGAPLLLTANTRTPTTEEPERLLSIREVADRLGVGLTTAYRLCNAGRLPVRRIGGSRRVRPDDLERFIEASLERP